jgi:hypothetical protein
MSGVPAAAGGADEEARVAEAVGKGVAQRAPVQAHRRPGDLAVPSRTMYT